MSNIFLDFLSWILGNVFGLLQFTILLLMLWVAANFVMALLKPDVFRKVSKTTYKQWIESCKRQRDNQMVNFWIGGTKKMATRLLGHIYGFMEIYLDPPDRTNFSNDADGLKKFKQATENYLKEKAENLDHCYVFLVKKWWQVWKTPFIYIVPVDFIIDDVMVGDIMVNTAGFLPVQGAWMIPSNVNRKRFTDIVKENNIYTAYMGDWDYIGNIAERAVESDNQFLKAKGIKEQILNVFKTKDQKK